MKAYKEIVAAVISAKTDEDVAVVGGMIDRAFETEKITWKDHEQLWALLSKVTALFR